jgi:hypothetical protein
MRNRIFNLIRKEKKMTRYEKMLLLSKMIGRKNLSKLQSILKYEISFRKIYKSNEQRISRDSKMYIFMVDGRTLHGGLSDRLRGAFSVYDYCKKKGYVFKILWTYPEKLQNYLVPASVEWEITPEEMIYDRRIVDFKFFNSYSFMDNDEEAYAKLLDSNKSIVHVYSNVTIHEEKYEEYFQELFKMSSMLNRAFNEQLEAIGSNYSKR